VPAAFSLTPAAMRKLQAYQWPGNVRQLRAVIESAAVMGEGDTIDADALPLTGAADASGPAGRPRRRPGRRTGRRAWT
jgi:DNA-binding NtrC family response regulator